MAHERMLRGGAAGAAATALWAAQEPLDMRLFGVSYSDTALLAKPFGGFRPAGWVAHLANGFVFGALYAWAAPRVRAPALAKGAAAGLAEHLASWPLTRFLPGVNLWGNRRAFWQATWRHLLFGLVLGALEARLNRGYAGDTPA